MDTVEARAGSPQQEPWCWPSCRARNHGSMDPQNCLSILFFGIELGLLQGHVWDKEPTDGKSQLLINHVQSSPSSPCRNAPQRMGPDPGVVPCRRPKTAGTQDGSGGRQKEAVSWSSHVLQPEGQRARGPSHGASLGRLLQLVPDGSLAGTDEAGTRGSDGYHGSQCGRAQDSSNPQGHRAQWQSSQPQGGAWAAEPSGPQRTSCAL